MTSLVSTGVPISTNLRLSYAEWAKGVTKQADERPGTYKQTSKFLVGFTRRLNIERWGSMTARLLLHDRNKAKQDDDSRLAEGEIRIEITSLKLNKTGQMKLDHLYDGNDGDEPAAAALSSAVNMVGGAVAALGSLTLSAMSGDVLVICKVSIPGDPIEVTDPVRVSRGLLGKPSKMKYEKRSYHGVQGDSHARARYTYLQEAMASKNPADSLLRISFVVADATGKEVRCPLCLARMRLAWSSYYAIVHCTADTCLNNCVCPVSVHAPNRCQTQRLGHWSIA